MATQTLIQRKSKNMKIEVQGKLPIGVTAKDIILSIIGKIGTAGGTGYVYVISLYFQEKGSLFLVSLN